MGSCRLPFGMAILSVRSGMGGGAVYAPADGESRHVLHGFRPMAGKSGFLALSLPSRRLVSGPFSFFPAGGWSPGARRIVHSGHCRKENEPTNQPQTNMSQAVLAEPKSANQELSDLIDAKFREFREGTIVKGTILEIRPKSFWSISATNPKERSRSENLTMRKSSRRRNRSAARKTGERRGHGRALQGKGRPQAELGEIVKVFQGEGLIEAKSRAVVKGGLTVNVGVEAFLPGSQIDVVPPKDLNNLSATLTISRSSR